MAEKPLKSPEEFTSAFEQIVSALHQPVAGALLSFAVLEAAETPQFISGRLLLCEEPQTPRPHLRYPTMALAEEWIPIERLFDSVAALAGGAITAGEACVRAAFTSFSLAREVGSHSNVSGWPEWRGLLRTDGRLRDYPREDVVKFGLPPFRSISHAVNDWVHRQPRNAESNSPLFSGELVIVVPDTRGRLLGAEWVGGTLAVASEWHSRDARSLQLQVRFLGDVEDSFHLIDPCPPDAQRSVPAGTESILVCLVHQDAGLLGDRLLGSYQRQREKPPAELMTIEAEAERDLEAGENEFVEYKPFIKVQDPKEDELERSVVAFANTGGGRLYIGATDEGMPLGARALKEVVKDAIDQKAALGVLARRLETVIASRIKPERPVFQVHELELKGFPLLMVRIDQGRQAYSTARETIYVRRGASNRSASIAEIRDLFARKDVGGAAVVLADILPR